jgi:hypothetical protein
MTDGDPHATGTPRWVKVFALVILLVVVLFVVVRLTGLGGEHGPRRHASSGAPTGSHPGALLAAAQR